MSHRISVDSLKCRDYFEENVFPNFPKFSLSFSNFPIFFPKNTFGKSLRRRLKMQKNLGERFPQKNPYLNGNKIRECRVTGITKQDHIDSWHIRGTLQVEEAIVEKVKNKRKTSCSLILNQSCKENCFNRHLSLLRCIKEKI